MSTHKFAGRTLARSQALQLLFQAEALGQTVSEVLRGPYAIGQCDPLDASASSGESEPLDEYAEYLALGADGMRAELDAVISRASTNWTVARMPAVDRNLLRLALYEMIFVDEVAIAITIDESVELAKAYGTDESSRFVNGLLGRVATDIENGVDVVDVACAQQGAED
ncbi:MAG: transcription antitermination factor NusB [Coriobacteriales bacterium]|nr:transcription antitermination factor NusB [Coriobacteriales bacterium]